MNILFVSSGNSNSVPDLPNIIIYNQGESLKKTGINIDYFLIKGKGIWGYFKNVRKLSLYIKKNSFDIVHAHFSLSSFISTIAMLNNHSIPLIVSLMGSDTKIKGLNRLLIKLLSQTLWEKTIVKSKEMQQNTNLKKSIIIPNGVDIDYIRISEINANYRKKRNLNNHQNILFVADPTRKSKNFPLAKKAVDSLGRSAVLKVAYNYSYNEIIEELFNTDVLLLTSLWEGSPNIIKEAMACNRPVVSTDVGDIRWLFGKESGHFISSFEPEDVAKKLNQALEFSNKYGQTNGRKRIIDLGLDSKSVAYRLLKVYEEAIKFKTERRKTVL